MLYYAGVCNSTGDRTRGEIVMAKDVITVDGDERVVREDTAKAYRAVNWTWISIAAFVVIVAIIAVTFFLKAGSNGPIDSPQRIGDSTRQ